MDYEKRHCLSKGWMYSLHGVIVTMYYTLRGTYTIETCSPTVLEARIPNQGVSRAHRL